MSNLRADSTTQSTAESASPTSAHKTPRVTHALMALTAIVGRELRKFSRQYGRLASAIVRPLLWLAVFAAGFRSVFGVSIIAPYTTYISYDEYILPGLMGMVLLFNGMQSSLALVYDREMGLMRLLLTAPLPRGWILFCKLCATVSLSVLQVLAFLIVAALIGVNFPYLSAHSAMFAFSVIGSAAMLAALGLLLSVNIKQLENFAGTMNFVIFPMYFISTALYPLWKLEESGAHWVFVVAQCNPFTHAVEWMRHSAYGVGGEADGLFSAAVVVTTALVCFGFAVWGYDPQKGFGALTKRGEAKA